MPVKNKFVPYEEQGYNQKKSLYDSISQSFEDFKRSSDVMKWNVPTEHLNGSTIKFLGENKLSVTYHCYEVTTVEGLARSEDEGYKFLDELVKGLKKKFKENTKKNLTLKEISLDRNLEKVSKLTAETSWMLGSSRYGYGNRPVGRYLIRYNKVFEVSSAL